ncbi:MAG TPA: hypothetical protein PLQ09_02860 [Prolixibacteraceae bacterium]|nr:hypothetical protein [Prolixibacteraceae bacterium]HQN93031.1 hypothetical protein [Prolixibacteraceae bacterium]
MTQEIIVYIILAITVVLIIYFYGRKKRPKKATAGKASSNCGSCTGCSLKDQCCS